MANKNPIKQVSLPGSNVTYDIQDNTLVEGTGISITTSSTEGSKGQRTIAVITGTTSSTVAVGNHAHGYISNTGTITSSSLASSSITGFLVYNSSNKIYSTTTGNVRTKLSLGYYHHSIYLYYSGSSDTMELYIDWYNSSKSTNYTNQNTFLHDFHTALKSSLNRHGLGVQGIKKFVRIHGVIKDGGHFYNVAAIDAYIDNDEDNSYYMLSIMFPKPNSTTMGYEDIDIDEFTFTDFSDTIIG